MSFGKRPPFGFGGVERRRDTRERTDVPAHIVLPLGQIINCRIADFSTTGARLAVPSVFGLPNTFELRADGRTYQVTVMRKSAGHIGVRFV